MHYRRISAGWLSDDMARALAALCPPLEATDVLQAADELSVHARSSRVVVVDSMLRPDVDPMNLRMVLEALHALHDLAR
jgi:hypothetical protein